MITGGFKKARHKQPKFIIEFKGTDWLFYTSTWRLEDNTEVSNIKITSKVASFSLVSYTPSLQDYGSAMIYNIGTNIFLI